MATYLVTGGGGFIGSHIVEKLVRCGETVRVLDNFSTGKRDNLKSLESEVELIEGDVRSYHIVIEAVRGVDYILHQAALPSVPRSLQDPITTTEVNVIGTLNILNAAVSAGVKRVICASSSSVYGNSEVLPKREEMVPSPLSPYAASKLSGEYYCKVFSNALGLETVCLRYFNVFGPNQDPTSQYSAVIPKFITLMKTGKSPVIYGDGEQSRDFTYVDNVVTANLLACRTEGISGDVFNCACSNRVTLNQLVDTLNGLLGASIKPIYERPRIGDVRHSYADISKAQRILDYSPDVSFLDGLRNTIAWFAAAPVR
jgi:UDP-glucose 4-epimerase